MAILENEKQRRASLKEILKQLKQRLVQYGEQICNGVTISAGKVYYTQGSTEKVTQQLQEDIEALLSNSTQSMWNKGSEDTEEYLKKHTTQAIQASWQPVVSYDSTSEAYKAFADRKEKGMNLSKRVWNLTKQYQKEIEQAVETAVKNGSSAYNLSTKVRQYLNNYNLFYKDAIEQGTTPRRVSHNIQNKAIRLARTEINMAYRKAENNRYNSEWFVVGYEIHTSGTHTPDDNDICEKLAGKYPKDFVWSGWHPNCKCYQTPILCSRDEMDAYDGTANTICTNSKNAVTSLPSNFNSYMKSKGSYIRKSKPYFYRDNKNLIDGR